MAQSYGTPGESARQRAELLSEDRRQLREMERQAKNWDSGARGEEYTGLTLAKRCPDVIVLNDRHWPGTRAANIDHIVVAPSGVWVIDSKRVKGRVEIRGGVSGGQRLIIRGRDRTKLVNKLADQVKLVRTAVDVVTPEISVSGGLCFWMPISKWGVLNPFNVDHSLPVLRAQSINGYYLFHPVAMRRQMNKSGSLSARERADLAAALAAQFPAAVPSSRDNSSSGLQLLKPPVRREAGSGPVRIEHENAAGWSGRTKAEKEQYRLAKEADHEREWEKQRSKVEAAFGQPVPLFLLQRLPADGRLWCHPALWHCRVYWRCIHGKVGTHFNYRQAGAVAATCHEGGTMRTLQWSALTGLLEHLREQGYISFDESLDGRIEEDILVLADLNNPPLRV